ncbi:hypothetical protein M885DRAFT_504925 [Pelagophyceae sp. CCMP2097]|nr:hypothetical protein M885DRAFT_504925 [Pelagophyceae sp. CCMP2097]
MPTRTSPAATCSRSNCSMPFVEMTFFERQSSAPAKLYRIRSSLDSLAETVKMRRCWASVGAAASRSRMAVTRSVPFWSLQTYDALMRWQTRAHGPHSAKVLVDEDHVHVRGHHRTREALDALARLARDDRWRARREERLAGDALQLLATQQRVVDDRVAQLREQVEVPRR